MKCVAEAEKALDATGAKSALVSFSGGKDSLAVLDLCTKRFDHVEAFFMYLIPGLECIEAELEKARKRWGVVIHQVPHWLCEKFIAAGLYRYPRATPEWKLQDVYQHMRNRTGLSLIAYGGKRSDGVWRQRAMRKGVATAPDVVAPLASWTKLHVVSYLRARGIPVPASQGGNVVSGIDLSTPSLLWLHDTHPKDFKRLTACYPFAWAAVRRRDFYGAAKTGR